MTDGEKKIVSAIEDISRMIWGIFIVMGMIFVAICIGFAFGK